MNHIELGIHDPEILTPQEAGMTAEELVELFLAKVKNSEGALATKLNLYLYPKKQPGDFVFDEVEEHTQIYRHILHRDTLDPWRKRSSGKREFEIIHGHSNRPLVVMSAAVFYTTLDPQSKQGFIHFADYLQQLTPVDNSREAVEAIRARLSVVR